MKKAILTAKQSHKKADLEAAYKLLSDPSAKLLGEVCSKSLIHEALISIWDKLKTNKEEQLKYINNELQISVKTDFRMENIPMLERLVVLEGPGRVAQKVLDAYKQKLGQ